MLVKENPMRGSEKMTLVDQHGKTLKKSRPVLNEIGAGSSRDLYSSYPSQGLTPERLAQIFKEADTGDVRRQAELFEEMEEKDAHLGSVMQTRKLAVAGLEWEVVPASDDKESGRISAFVREALFWVENWDEALIDLLDAVGKGFSVGEVMWEISEGRAWIKDIRWRHQKLFTFFERSGGLAPTPRLLTEKAPVYGEVLVPNKFVVHAYRARSGVTARGGVLRPCAYMYLFKNYTLKDWVVFNERYAMPMRVGKFGPGTSEADRKILKRAVFNLSNDAAAVISDSTVIELLEQAGKRATAEVFERLAEFCDRSMSKAVLGHTGSAESSPGRLGGENEARAVRQDLLEADAKALAKTITMQLIRPLVEFNFGPGTNLPVFRFKHEAGVDLKALADTYATLVRDVEFKGIPDSHIRERFGIPQHVKGGD
jgi:phage gp29-like protein